MGWRQVVEQPVRTKKVHNFRTRCRPHMEGWSRHENRGNGSTFWAALKKRGIPCCHSYPGGRPPPGLRCSPSGRAPCVVSSRAAPSAEVDQVRKALHSFPSTSGAGRVHSSHHQQGCGQTHLEPGTHWSRDPSAGRLVQRPLWAVSFRSSFTDLATLVWRST